jgi:DNA polymerase-4
MSAPMSPEPPELPELLPSGVAGQRLVAHLDMDAFYASVELLRRPELRGLALVVGGGRRNPAVPDLPIEQLPRLKDYVGRGVITTSTYEARKFGVFSGMGLMKSARLAPEALLLPADFDAYRHHSRLFKAAVAGIAPLIEDRGIDEIYLELGDVPGARDGTPDDPQAGIRALGQRLKAAVKAATGLTCSIGIAPNKLLAKICSELDKPDGLTLLTHADIPARIWPLPVRRINGIGPKAEFKLQGFGIQTIGELATFDRSWLVERFGKSYGAWLFEASHGLDDRLVVTHSEPVSISRETTFDRDLHPRTDRDELTRILTRLCEQLAADLARKGYAARTVGVKVRFDDFRSVTRDSTLGVPVAGAAALLAGARQCLKRIQFSRRLRLLGVRASNLCDPHDIEQLGADARAARAQAPELTDMPAPDRPGPARRERQAAAATARSAAQPTQPTRWAGQRPLAAEEAPGGYTLPLFDDDP